MKLNLGWLDSTNFLLSLLKLQPACQFLKFTSMWLSFEQEDERKKFDPKKKEKKSLPKGMAIQ